MKNLYVLLLLCTCQLGFGQFGEWSDFAQEQYENTIKENAPKAFIEYTTGSENMDEFRRFNEEGLQVSHYRFKYDFSTKQNNLVSADSAIYNEKGQLTKRIYYEGSKNGPTPTGSLTVEFRDDKKLVERKSSIGYPSLSWEKKYSYNKAGQLEKVEKFVPNDSTGKLEETIIYSYDSKGNKIKEEKVSTMYGSKRETDYEYAYDEDGKMIEAVFNGSGYTIKRTYSFEEDRLTEIKHFESYGEEKLKEVESGTLSYDEQGRLKTLNVQGIKDPNYFFKLAYQYDTEHNLPIREVIEFQGSSRTYTFDQSFNYYWW
jgi:hypothetical protein